MNVVLKLIEGELKSENEQKVFAARYAGNFNQPQKPMNYSEIASVLGLRTSQVESIIFHFWKRLKPKLKNKLSGSSVDDTGFLVMLQRRRRLIEYFDAG
jgi:DNA-directed RNA polymerase specialized sigma subunit